MIKLDRDYRLITLKIISDDFIRIKDYKFSSCFIKDFKFSACFDRNELENSFMVLTLLIIILF